MVNVFFQTWSFWQISQYDDDDDKLHFFQYSFHQLIHRLMKLSYCLKKRSIFLREK